MLEEFHLNKKTHLTALLEYVTSEFDFDFYFTENNSRLYAQDEKTLKRFLKQCRHIYLHYDKLGDINGLIMVWKSVGGGKERFYLKMKYRDLNVARNLLTILLWNIKSDVYIKIRKDNSTLPVLRNKGFRFLGGRGLQILLVKKFKPREEVSFKYERDEEDED